ncbi:hypothetical protein [Spirosoma pollinicola]|uniref:Uncharacterized protein n=1 Tax=Spirosoma pollinicola TaxID=2057025 RepID=A0A2K8Z323_9BACT|nr:hypothetical protein [Spirosoma pollinicola]AUD04277.1 hypothetical protein CWM47_21985 [Spirosoma pollinicola]
MNVQRFEQLTLSEQVIVIPLKGRFIAQRQNNDLQVKLYYWNDHFLEIHYQWPINRGKGAHWEPFQVTAFMDNTRCADRLSLYAEQVNLGSLFV